MKKRLKKKYQPQFTLEEIQQLLDWERGEFSGSGKLHRKLLQIKQKLAKQL